MTHGDAAAADGLDHFDADYVSIFPRTAKGEGVPGASPGGRRKRKRSRRMRSILQTESSARQ